MTARRSSPPTALIPEAEPVAARVSTGVEGLDWLLQGGLVRGNSLLIEGPPGSGKSTLGVRIVHEGIVRHREPAVMIAFEEFPRQIYGEALACGVDLREHERDGRLRVLWTSPERVLESFRGHADLVHRVLDELGARRLVIDSITHFKRLTASEQELREMLTTVLCDLKRRQVSTFLVHELDEGSAMAFAEYLVDASLRLHHDPAASRPGTAVRRLEVRKTRGQGHVPGRHPFELGSDGFSVHPRVRPGDVERLLGGPVDRSRAVLATGLPELDAMLGGGLARGGTCLLVGPAGSGKAMLAQQVVDAGLRAGERCLHVALRESLDDVLSRASGLAADWPRALAEGRLSVLCDHEASTVESLHGRLLRVVGELRPARVVVDGIDDPPLLTADPVEAHERALVLARLAAAGDLLLLATREGEPDPHAGLVSGGVAARLSHAVLQLGLRVDGSRLVRDLRVVKHAGGTPLEGRPVELTGAGLRIADGR